MRQTYVLLLALALTACSHSQPASERAEPTPSASAAVPATQPAAVAQAPATSPTAVRVLSVADFHKMQQTHPEYVLLDVRTPAEFAAGYIPGAKLIDIKSPDFQQKIAQLDGSKTYLVYCRSGNRSSVACQKLQKLNVQAFNLAGGIVAWQQAKLPTTMPTTP